MSTEIISDFTREKLKGPVSLHKWYGRRGKSTSLISLLLAVNPELAIDKEALRQISDKPDEYKTETIKDLKILDLCCGSGSLSEAAARLGAAVTAVDNHPIPILMARIALQYSQLFAKPSQADKGCSKDKTWAGLAEEISYWLKALLIEAKSKSDASWLNNVDFVQCERIFQCPNCLIHTHLPSRKNREQSSLQWLKDANLQCTSCGQVIERTNLNQIKIASKRTLMLGDDVSSAQSVESCLNSDYPDALIDGLGSIWYDSKNPRESLRLVDFCSPRQGQLLVALRHSFRVIRDRVTDLEYDSLRAKAVLESLALCLSNTIEFLSYSCSYDDRLKRITGLTSARWVTRSDYTEIGGSRLESIITKNADKIIKTIEELSTVNKANVVAMDMQNVARLGDMYDIILWDPPYFNCIDYAGVAKPWTVYLRSLLGGIDTLLPWDKSLTAGNSAMPENGYKEEIKKTIGAITTVLNPGGKLGLLWMQKDNESFGYLLDEATKHGLELIQSYSLLDSKSLEYGDKRVHATSACVLIVLSRTVGPAIPADAVSILSGASEGRSMMYEGIVEILTESLEDDELESLISEGYKGTRLQRLAETVMSSPNPIDLLRDVHKGDLKKYALSRGISEEDLAGKSTSQLRREVLQLLGWSIPSYPKFTIERTLDELAKIEAEIRLVNSEQEIRGLATKAFDRLERILRFTVTTWACLISPDDWKKPVKRITTKDSRYAFGDWHRCLIEMPGKYAVDSETMGRVNRLLNKHKVQKTIEPILKLRNTVCHHDESKDNWFDIKKDLMEKLPNVTEALKKAYIDKALPLVLVPEKETRDMYGRITLRLTSNSGRPHEFLMTQQTDLSRPVVVIACGSNPREVEPWLKNAEDLCLLASV